jgi:uncharacterized protein
MNLFFDTSALVKYFHTEAGSAAVNGLVDSDENAIWISELARVEFCSSLFRRFRSGEIQATMLATAIDGFSRKIEQFSVEPVTRMVMAEAENLVKKHGKVLGLRTLDSLQLASFMLVQDQGWRFVVSDNALANTARAIGFDVVLVKS